MVKLMRTGRVVIVVAGKYAGRKGIIVKQFDEGTSDKPYGHALIAGIDRNPRRIIKRMSKKKAVSRSKIKAFVKIINYSHLMPTRYFADIPFDKSVLTKENIKDKGSRRKARLHVKLLLEDKYKSGKLKWVFTKLHF